MGEETPRRPYIIYENYQSVQDCPTVAIATLMYMNGDLIRDAGTAAGAWVAGSAQFPAYGSDDDASSSSSSASSSASSSDAEGDVDGAMVGDGGEQPATMRRRGGGGGAGASAAAGTGLGSDAGGRYFLHCVQKWSFWFVRSRPLEVTRYFS